MKIAFVITKYSPFGGLERDFLRLAQTALDRGHEVFALVMAWRGPKPSGIKINYIKTSGVCSHRRFRDFAENINQHLSQERYDYVVGFNKMPGLDAYFAGDPCFADVAAKKHNALVRMLPRYNTYLKLEEAVFNPKSKTNIVVINDSEKQIFQEFYQTQDERFFQVAPAIEKEAVNLTAEEKIALRNKYNIPDNAFWLLFIGSDFSRKGLDRAMLAIKEISLTVRLMVVGSGNKKQLLKLADQYGVAKQVIAIEATVKTMQLMSAADLLIHPARIEAGGKVLIEAMLSGLPVLATEVCGYAKYITEAGSGVLLSEPFNQADCQKKLADMLQLDRLLAFRRAALAYPNKQQFYQAYAKMLEQFDHWAKHETTS